VLSSLLLLTAFLPVVWTFLPQFAARSRRLTAAGHGGLDVHRLLVRPPSILLRLFAGGMIPEDPAGLTATTAGAVLTGSAALLQGAAAAAALAHRGFGRPFRLWTAGILVLPFVVFLKDDPTPRHFPLAWLALALGIACLASRWRWTGPVAASFCLVTLVPYYGLESWPYHRSDWEGAVRAVEERALEGDAVILRGAKTAQQAWDFYASGDLERFSPHCTDPYRGEEEAAPRLDPVPVMEGLLAEGRRVWLVDDSWGGPPLESVTGGRAALFDSTAGTIRILLLGPPPAR